MKPIISKNIRVRYPKHFSIGDYSIIDDFCYFSAKIVIGKSSHIANGCSIAGGKNHKFTLGDFCSISSGVKIWVESHDFVNDLITLKPDNINIGDKPLQGDITIGNYFGIGSNSVIMPDNNIPEGVSIGSLSFVPVKFNFKTWSVYTGITIKLIKSRNKENVLKQLKKLENKMKDIDKNE